VRWEILREREDVEGDFVGDIVGTGAVGEADGDSVGAEVVGDVEGDMVDLLLGVGPSARSKATRRRGSLSLALSLSLGLSLHGSLCLSLTEVVFWKVSLGVAASSGEQGGAHPGALAHGVVEVVCEEESTHAVP